ncbi:39k protein [Oxyplax ochracea nucleopolyhedrovirus]|uniref:39k protein n=1 Tax=Oxyplax ochracea nucleopolyhedrovirus TaxID=2083176 RepID=A0A2L0WU91_9ABAC|nr:39k protein [Oxyplax ochracea nucleopolyhedrovirus]AVA31218.1 39k protein [Oxyplax ochracea nucleopolyhedrovirus]
MVNSNNVTTTTTTLTTENDDSLKPFQNFINSLETSIYNRSNINQLCSVVNFFEKKKYCYTISVTPVIFDDRKMLKRTKKVINNNKYILFNSWYTKIKQSNWLSSPAMWDLIKTKTELTDFVFIFDYVEKLGKKTTGKFVTETTNKKKKLTSLSNNATLEMKENCQLRDKLYFEFFNMLNETFKHSVAPANSNIYDDVLTRDLVTKSVEKFKSVALRICDVYVPTPVNSVKNKKRKIFNKNDDTTDNIITSSINKRVVCKRRNSSNNKNNIVKRSTTLDEEFSMVNDNTQDTNMSD